jgi:hypothetical protein
MNAILFCSVVSLILCLPGLALAQPVNAQQGTISVSGTADMTKPPEIIRIYFKQFGKGTDLEAAKTGLVAAEKKLHDKLKEFGAEIVLSNSGIASPSQTLLSQAQNVVNMIRNRRMAQGDNSPPEKSNISYLERVVTIDIKPKSKQKETMSLLADLQERLRKDYQELSGMSEALPKDEANDANRNEISTYLRSNSNMYGNEIRYQLASKVTREDRIKLYAEAMRRARSIAEDLAEAAGMKVGALQTISSSFSNVYTNYSQGGRMITSTGELAKFPITLKEDGSETLAIREVTTNYQGGTVEPITFQVSLSTSFKLEPGKSP